MPQVEMYFPGRIIPKCGQTHRSVAVLVPGAIALPFPVPTLTLKHSVKNDQAGIKRHPYAS